MRTRLRPYSNHSMAHSGTHQRPRRLLTTPEVCPDRSRQRCLVRSSWPWPSQFSGLSAAGSSGAAVEASLAPGLSAARAAGRCGAAAFFSSAGAAGASELLRRRRSWRRSCRLFGRLRSFGRLGGLFRSRRRGLWRFPSFRSGAAAGASTGFSSGAGFLVSAGASVLASFFVPDSTAASDSSTASRSCCSTPESWLSTGAATAGLNPPPPNIMVATSAVVAVAPTVERTMPFLHMVPKSEPRRESRRSLCLRVA